MAFIKTKAQFRLAAMTKEQFRLAVIIIGTAVLSIGYFTSDSFFLGLGAGILGVALIGMGR